MFVFCDFIEETSSEFMYKRTMRRKETDKFIIFVF